MYSTNDFFSKFDELGKKDLLSYLNEYIILYRDTIGIDSNVSFGLELESDNSNDYEIEKLMKINDFNDWETKIDLSLPDGIEIASPILYDTKETWIKLKEVCNILKNNSNISSLCGGHIHIGTQLLNNDLKKLDNILKVWAVYENVIYRFGYGEFINPRFRLEKYAKHMRGRFIRTLDLNYIKKAKDIWQYFFMMFDRNVGLNIGNARLTDSIQKKNTFEVRSPNGTIEEIIIQNNINFFTKMFLYSVSNNYDEEFIDYKFKGIDPYVEIESYSLIDIEKALELSDLIFDNNLDKFSFLKQYFKDMREEESNELIKSNTFIKK